MGFIIWLVGMILTVKAVLEIWKMSGDTAKKLIFIVLLLVTSWLGLAFYYFFAKNQMSEWLK